ncbi:hypothetical protein [Henriciella sp.]|uniref:hypothetical protein n=1 Tax=Henriciella sp. TaxID=1968823 RepID=UPI00261DFAC7|nr:hypothetical protein [Henriciella sp.]
MKLIFGTTGVLALGLMASACTTGQTGSTATLSNGQKVAQIREEVRQDLIQQGLDPDEEVCKRVEQMGSVIPKNTCATRAMWAAKTRASQEGTRDIQNNALRTRDPRAGG